MATFKLSKKAMLELKEKAESGDVEAIEKLKKIEADLEKKEKAKQARIAAKGKPRKASMSEPPMTHIVLEDQTLGSPIDKLSKDLKEQVTHLSIEDVRYLVDAFYQVQDNRIRSSGQVRASEEYGESNGVLVWMDQNNRLLENNIKKALDIYTDYHPVGRWLKSITGIAAVLAAGLLAHLDVSKAETAGAFWRFAGLDPSMTWEKGQKRPWNAELKKHMWKIADSFVKQSGRESDYYGKLYLARKQYEHTKNDNGEYAQRASNALSKKRYVNETATKAVYEQGKITDGHIDSSARRYTEKIFLSHLHHIMYVHHFKRNPPRPFALDILGHAHMIKIPNLDIHYDDLMDN